MKQTQDPSAHQQEATGSAKTRATGRTVVSRLAGFATFGIHMAMAVGAIALGTGLIELRALAVSPAPSAPLTTVEVQPVVIEDGYFVERNYIGRVEAARETRLAFERPGTVMAIDVAEGQAIVAGDTIARLDMRTLEAQRVEQMAARRAAASEAELAKLTLERRAALQDRGFSSTQELDRARLTLEQLEARIAQIDAALVAIDVNLNKSVLRAPYDGIVGERMIDEGTAIASGSPVINILEKADAHARIGLTPEQAATLSRNKAYDIEVAGQLYKARFLKIRPDLQPETRTVDVVFELLGQSHSSYGQVAALRLNERVDERGAWLELSALKEGERGTWTVLLAEPVAQTDTATLVKDAVEILHIANGKAFVRGALEDGMKLLVAGTHKVAAGEKVRVLEHSAIGLDLRLGID